MKKDGWFASLQNLTWLTQLGLSLTVPPVLCLLLAGWLAERFLLGPWVWLAAILLGLGASACTFAEFMRMFLRRSGRRPPEGDPQAGPRSGPGEALNGGPQAGPYSSGPGEALNGRPHRAGPHSGGQAGGRGDGPHGGPNTN